VVGSDLPCDWCGTNLRGTAVDGECPSCSLAVEHSLRADRIEFVGRAALVRVCAGVALLMIEMFGSAALTLAPRVLRVIDAVGVPVWRLQMSLNLLLGAIGVLAAFLITSVEVGRLHAKSDIGRGLIRGLMLGAFAASACVLWLSWEGGQSSLASDVGWWAESAIGVVWTAGYVGLLVRLGRFARRARRPSLAWFTAVVIVIWLVNLAASLLFVTLYTAGTLGQPELILLALILGTVPFFTRIATAVLLAWDLGVLARYARRAVARPMIEAAPRSA
jgi:hypothetical protein